MEAWAKGWRPRPLSEGSLELDKSNRTALSSLGYSGARQTGMQKLAESYFRRAIEAHPKDYEPRLALGDLYTAAQDFPRRKELRRRLPAHAQQRDDHRGRHQCRAGGAQSRFGEALAGSGSGQTER